MFGLTDPHREWRISSRPICPRIRSSRSAFRLPECFALSEYYSAMRAVRSCTRHVASRASRRLSCGSRAAEVGAESSRAEVRCGTSKDRLPSVSLLPGWLFPVVATGLFRAPAKPLPFADGAPRPLPGAALTLRQRGGEGGGGLPVCRDDAAHSRAEHTTRTPTRNRSRSLRWRLITFASCSAASRVKLQ